MKAKMCFAKKRSYEMEESEFQEDLALLQSGDFKQNPLRLEYEQKVHELKSLAQTLAEKERQQKRSPENYMAGDGRWESSIRTQCHRF